MQSAIDLADPPACTRCGDSVFAMHLDAPCNAFVDTESGRLWFCSAECAYLHGSYLHGSKQEPGKVCPAQRQVIDGWECWEREDGTRQILEKTTLATMTWSFARGIGAAAHGVPTAVLGWLIKPLLRTAYAEGWADRNGQLDGSTMPDVYKDQP